MLFHLYGMDQFYSVYKRQEFFVAENRFGNILIFLF